MRRIVRLTESDLARIVRRVINEQTEVSPAGYDEEEIDMEIEDLDENEDDIKLVQKVKMIINRLGRNVKTFKGRQKNKFKRLVRRLARKDKKIMDCMNMMN
jgi:hypothetical protein